MNFDLLYNTFFGYVNFWSQNVLKHESNPIDEPKPKIFSIPPRQRPSRHPKIPLTFNYIAESEKHSDPDPDQLQCPIGI